MIGQNESFVPTIKGDCHVTSHSGTSNGVYPIRVLPEWSIPEDRARLRAEDNAKIDVGILNGKLRTKWGKFKQVQANSPIAKRMRRAKRDEDTLGLFELKTRKMLKPREGIKGCDQIRDIDKH